MAVCGGIGHDQVMLDDSPLDHLSDTEVRALAQRLLAEVRHKQATGVRQLGL